MSLPAVLDPCCGHKSFYFEPDNAPVLFCDNRRISTTLCDGRSFDVSPDLVADVTKLPFDNEAFALVVFDPPQLVRGNGWQVTKYGKLPKDWKAWMTRAFSECWRVLRPNGTMIFKWNSYSIALKEILKCAPVKPLLGNRKPKSSKTHWLVFFKEVE